MALICDIVVVIFCAILATGECGILFPQDSETRETRSLDGIWSFRIAPRNDPQLGFTNEWFSQRLEQSGVVELMPVPSSYNDLTQNRTIRDHVGWAWYDREFWIPRYWASRQRIFLRFGGVNYHAIVWVNGVRVVEHAGGHLPFHAELDPTLLSFNSANWITVAVNNTLSDDTVPQGKVIRPAGDRYPPGYFTLQYSFDFFNYAGIHRPVYLYTTPKTYIDDMTVTTNVDTRSSTGTLSINVNVVPESASRASSKSGHLIHDTPPVGVTVMVHLEDKTGNTVVSQIGTQEHLIIPQCHFWWPYTMVKNDTDAGYLYTLVVSLLNERGGQLDVYRLKVGIRSVHWDQKGLTINNRPFYFRGFGRHEDFDIRGRGIDNVMLVKDHNLVKWTGANSYRTSHYPYSEEIMDLTDQLGIVIIDEISAVSLDGFGAKLLKNHKEQMTELIQRDKNRPSVVMWSVGNEPQSQKPAAENYFRQVVDLTRALDPTRPVTLVINKYSEVISLTRTIDPNRPVTLVVAQNYDRDVTAHLLDVICINRYFSWYSDTGHTEVITKSMILDVQNWINKFNRPVIVAEYGADTVAGLHMSPEFVFTEEYQLEFMKEHFKAFDYLRNSTSLIGEMIWNFADFMTAQGITRITGNRKGIFTRERQPKASAHLLRKRYHFLAKQHENYPVPQDILEDLAIF